MDVNFINGFEKNSGFFEQTVNKAKRLGQTVHAAVKDEVHGLGTGISPKQRLNTIKDMRGQASVALKEGNKELAKDRNLAARRTGAITGLS